MTKEKYWARRAANLCARGGCTRPPESSTMCKEHLEKHRLSKRQHPTRYNPAVYMQRKVDGLCVQNYCKIPPMPDRLLCPRHHKRNVANSTKWRNKSPRNHRLRMKTQQRWRRKMREMGRCVTCGMDAALESQTRCGPCHQRQLEYSSENRRKRGERIRPCKHCKSTEHRPIDCRARVGWAGALPVEHYATARNSDA